MSIKTVLRTIIASGLVVGTAAALSPAAFAGTTSSGTQQGTIAATGSVAYTAGATLPITPNLAQNDKDFGSVNVESNDNAGWTLAVASTNGSMLKNGTIGTIAYALKVDGVTVDVSAAGTPALTSLVPTTLTAATVGGTNYPVTGSIAAADSNGKPSGTYSDTLTFTLTNR